MGGYELADFIPYDAVAWQSLYAQYLSANAALATALTFAIGLTTVLALRTARAWPILLVLSIGWFWLGFQFHRQWHIQLNWAADYWASAFYAQAAFLLIGTLIAWRGEHAFRPNRWQKALLFLPFVLPPLAGLLIARWPVDALQWVGAAPDPTVWLTAMVIITSQRAIYLAILMIPVFSLAASMAAAWVIGAADLLFVLGATIASVLAGLVAGKTTGNTNGTAR